MDKNEFNLKKIELEHKQVRHKSRMSYIAALTKNVFEILHRITAVWILPIYVLIYCAKIGLLTPEQFADYTGKWVSKVLDENTWQGYLILGESLLLVILGATYLVAEFIRIPNLEKSLAKIQEKLREESNT